MMHLLLSKPDKSLIALWLPKISKYEFSLSLLHRWRVYGGLGFVHILRNHFLEVKDRILQPEVATVGFDHRPQHL